MHSQVILGYQDLHELKHKVLLVPEFRHLKSTDDSVRRLF